MPGPFIHNIDPVIARVGGFYLWYYGLSYTLGFLGVFLWLKRMSREIHLGPNEIYGLSIFLSAAVLLGGRLVEVIFYEWAYYGSHLWHVPAVWLGGMSTHGILFGAVIGTWLFCRRYNKSFLAMADVLAIAGAYIMGVGRIGNFIDGQIVGSVTGVWWAVKFPDAEGFRHPVVLYDGLKNLMLIPFLLLIKRSKPPRGVVMANFLLWYGFLRIFVDFFREYRTDFFGFPPGQEFNIFMTLIGISLLVVFYRRRKKGSDAPEPAVIPGRPATVSSFFLWVQRTVFAGLLLLPLVIPSDWTQDVPARYGKRHQDMSHSILYPRIEAPVE